MTSAIVIGAGHNGLTAACYLARAGVKVTVLERREQIGGAAVTEELLPGFKVSAASYSLSLLRPDIYDDLRLAEHGLSFYPKDPQLFVPLPDGRHFFVWRDEARTVEELKGISPADADAYVRFGRFWEHAVSVLRPLAESSDPPRRAEVEKVLAEAGEERVWKAAVAGSVAEIVEEFFESEPVQGAFASQGIIGTALGPREEGTAWVMAYHYLGGELNGSTGTWAYVRGGMGSVTSSLASAARSLGATIESGAGVAEVLIDNGRASGVRTEDGKVHRADLVLSNADPATSFLRLLPPGSVEGSFVERVEGWKTPGSVIKVNLALDELPDFTALPGAGPQQAGTIEISPSIDYLETAWEDSRSGRCSDRPFMEVFIQSASDPTLAPEGKHVLSAFTQYAPPHLSAEQWQPMKQKAYGNVLEVLGSYAPNIPGSVLSSDVLGPIELEQRFGLPGGNIFHGEITPDQSFGERFSYRTPVEGYYLCGSGTSPGGGVMGAPGRNAAKVVLTDVQEEKISLSTI